MDQDNELLRFITAGSVDDGKSTLIGRLLYDSKSIYEDQYDSVKKATEQKGEEGIDFALLTDGLKSEREQGITIDVAYRYFSTPKRKFIIADTPGHIQYTRNMVTGASTANVALILIDARKGVVEQTKRHAIIASLLQISHVLVCINKMDLVEYRQETFNEIRHSFEFFAKKLDVKDIQYIPISALYGDNIVQRSPKMPWYEGATIIYYLENVHIASDHNYRDVRFPVQMVIRSNTGEFQDYRGYAGRVASGVIKKGDKVHLLPSGFDSEVKKIMTMSGELDEAKPPQSVTILIEDDLDLSRGDMIVRVNNQPIVSQDLEVMLCWFNARKSLNSNEQYFLKHTTKDVRCIIKKIRYRLDINTLHRGEVSKTLKMNDIGRVSIRTTKPLFIDPYRRNRQTGAIILIDKDTNNTVAAGMII